MNTIMNHELVHVATMDQAAGSDRMFRRLFGGKVLPVTEQPESILYFYLTSPRVAAPRWFHEGIAVFVDTWMAGGLGRVQSGYDEMVFRAMVRDNAPFYNPLGLVSKGTDVDFQLEINSYLYGTRFMTWLARRYSPEQLIEWTARREGSRAYYAAQFRKVFGIEPRRGVGAVDRRRADVPAGEPRGDSQVSGHALSRRHQPRARLGVARLFRSGLEKDLRRLQLSGRRRARRRDRHRHRRGRAHRADQGPGHLHRDVAGLGSGRAHALLHDRQRIVARSDAARSGNRQDAPAAERRAHRRHRLQQGRQGAVGHPPSQRLRHDRAHSGAVHVVGADGDAAVRHDRLRSRRLAGRHEARRRRSARSPAAQDVRVLSVEALKKRDATPLARFDFAQSVPNDFTFSADGRYLYGSSYLTGVSNIFRYELATGTVEAVSNTETGFFRPVPLGGDELLVFRYTGTGFVPTRIAATPVADASPITFLGERLAADHPVVHSWNVGSPMVIPYESLEKQQQPYRLLGGLRPESFYPIVQGYKNTAAVGMRCNLSDRIRLNRASVAASFSPVTDLPVERTAARRRRIRALRLARSRRVQQGGFLRSVRPDQDRPQGLRGRRRPIDDAHLR